MNPRKTISCLLVAAALLATIITPSLAGEKPAAAKHDGPPGKPYVYKTSAGKERSMEIYFPPGHEATKAKVPGLILFHGGGWRRGDKDEWLKGWTEAHRKWKSLGVEFIEYLVAANEGHGFFNQPDWHTVTLIAADDFLVKHGLLSGKATLTPPDKDKRLHHQNP